MAIAHPPDGFLLSFSLQPTSTSSILAVSQNQQRRLREIKAFRQLLTHRGQFSSPYAHSVYSTFFENKHQAFLIDCEYSDPFPLDDLRIMAEIFGQYRLNGAQASD